MTALSKARQQYRTTQCTAEIILPKCGLLKTKVVVEPIVGVEDVISQVVVGATVELISTCFRFKGELPARIAAVFRRIARALYAKLLKGIHRDQRLRSSESGRSGKRAAGTRTGEHILARCPPQVSTDPVHGVIVRIRALAIHTEFTGS